MFFDVLDTSQGSHVVRGGHVTELTWKRGLDLGLGFFQDLGLFFILFHMIQLCINLPIQPNGYIALFTII